MGPAVKYLSSVRNRFWIKNAIAASGMANSIGMTWEGSDNQTSKPDKEFDLSVFAGATTAQNLLGMPAPARKLHYDKEMQRLFPGYSTGFINSQFMSWPTEPWTKAGYSFPNIGEVCSKIKSLNQGYNERMLFAGEHTCLAFVGYMEGALHSGSNAAKGILEKIKHLN